MVGVVGPGPIVDGPGPAGAAPMVPVGALNEDDVDDLLETVMLVAEEQKTIESAEVCAVFRSESSRVAGCMVLKGKLVKGYVIKVVRRLKTIYVDVHESLWLVEDDVREVTAGLECGFRVEDFDEWEEGDAIKAFNTIEKKRTLK